jgi:hypothetical protein
MLTFLLKTGKKEKKEQLKESMDTQWKKYFARFLSILPY